MNCESELQELRNWLNQDKRDYDAGLQLYTAYFNDVDMRRYLVAHRPEAKLYELIRNRVIELKEGLQVKAPAPVEVVKSPVEPKAHVAHGRPGHKEEILAKLETEWKQLRAEQGVWHTQMCDIGADDKGKPREILTKDEIERRCILARQLMQHDKAIFEIWNKIDYVEINGVLPVPDKKKSPVIANEDDFKRLKNSVMPGISKLKKKIKDQKAMMPSTGKEFEKVNKKLGEWEKQLEDLETEKLKLTNGDQQSTE